MNERVEQTTDRKDGLHCVYGTCRGFPNSPVPCNPGCYFQGSAINNQFGEWPSQAEAPVTLGPGMNTPQPNSPTRIGFDPGSFGCHEALHMASVLMEMVDERLCQHPSVIANEEWEELAERACSALSDLYQAIGAKHL